METKKRSRSTSPSSDSHTIKKRKLNDYVDRVHNGYQNSKNQSSRERRDLRTYNLRIFNNWVKSVLISKYLNVIDSKSKSILDICCGKGGDLKKWNVSNVYSVTFVDLVQKSIENAKDRYKKLNRNDRPNAIFIASNAHTLSLFKYLTIKGIAHDLVSCQFALHYSFENEEKANNLIKNVSCGLKDGGYFIGTIPNESIIKEKMKNKEYIKNQFFEIQYDKEKNLDGSGFGQEYTFYLEDAVDYVPEFLVNFEKLKEIASNHDLEFVEAKTFRDFYKENVVETEYQDLLKRMTKNNDINVNEVPLSQDFVDIIDLYMVFAFRKKSTGLEKTNIEQFWLNFKEENPRTTSFYYSRNLL